METRARDDYTLYTEVGIQISGLKLALRLPKMRKPRLFKKRGKDNKSDSGAGGGASSGASSSSSSEDELSSVRAELLRKYNSIGRRKKLGSAGGSGSSLEESAAEAASDDWMRDFHRRYNPVVLKAADKTAADQRRRQQQLMDESVLSGGGPDLTSTPVNLRIRPLNRVAACRSEPLEVDSPAAASADTDLSGVKIYENIETSGGMDMSLAQADLNASYEIVTIDRRVLARAHFRPKSLIF